MSSWPILPGFVVNSDQRPQPDMPERWLNFFEVPISEDFPTIITFVIEVPERDSVECDKVYKEAVSLGYGFHIRFNQGSYGLGDARARWPKATIAYGNGLGVADGLETPWGDVYEDDAGVASAVRMSRLIKANGMEPKPIAFHAYGDAGFNPERHIPLLRKWYPDQKFIITEGHWGFEKYHPTATANYEDHHTTQAGDWCGYLAKHAAEADIPVCLFRAVDFFDGSGPKDSAIALRYALHGYPVQWHFESPVSRTTRSMYWQRYKPW